MKHPATCGVFRGHDARCTCGLYKRLEAQEDADPVDKYAERSWALSVLLAYIGNAELASAVASLGAINLQRFGAVVEGFKSDVVPPR